MIQDHVFLPALSSHAKIAQFILVAALALTPIGLAARDMTLQIEWTEAAPSGAELVIGFQNNDGQTTEGYRARLDAGSTRASISLRDVPRQVTRLQPGLVLRGQIIKSALARPLTPATEDTPFRLTEADALRYSELWSCDDGQQFGLIRTDEEMLVQRDPTALRLTRSMLNTSRYLDEAGNGLRMIANRAVLTPVDETAALCAPLPSAPLQPLSAEGFPPRGTDLPGWSALLTGGTLSLFGPDTQAGIGPDATAAALPVTVSRLPDGAMRLTTAKGQLDLEQRLCRIGDEMTPYPFAASLLLAGQEGPRQPGCAGNSAALLHGGIWHVLSLFGQPVDSPAFETTDLTAEFSGDQIAGRSACNRYVGTVIQQGTRISFEGLATTRLECPESLAGLERRFLDALEQVTSFDISPNGTLVLFSGQTPVMAAQR